MNTLQLLGNGEYPNNSFRCERCYRDEDIIKVTVEVIVIAFSFVLVLGLGLFTVGMLLAKAIRLMAN